MMCMLRTRDIFLRALKKISLYLFLLIAILSFIYLSARLIPGDPITVLYGEISGDPVTRSVLERQLGLDKPIQIHLLIYLRNIFTGNWGKSIYTGESVVSIVSRGFMASLKLALLSSAFVVIISIALVYVEFVHNIHSNLIRISTSLSSSIQSTVWSIIILLLIARTGYSVALGSILPPLSVLTITGIGIFYRVLRSAIEYSCRQPFVGMYMVMGYNKRYLFLKVLRYSLPMILSALLYRVGVIIAGAVATEVIFMYPGMGFVFYTALLSRDYPILIGWGVAISIILMLVNLVVDIVHSVLDPRVSIS
uniref:ABC transporter permease n=1 Tax=Ignisphaera aggregans TaxID=334771 RepID=A0A832EW38_9CREN